MALDPEDVRRVLVLRPGAIGDTLVTLPALLALRHRFPTAKIEVAGNATALPLAQAIGLIDTWIGFDDNRVTRLFMAAEPAPGDYLQGIDVAIAWGRDADGTLERGFRRRGAQQVIVAPSRPDPARPELVARHLLRTLEPLGIALEPPEIAIGDSDNDPPPPLPEIQLPANAVALPLPDIRLPPEVEAMAHAELAAAGLDSRTFVAIHPGSGSLAKNWPAEQFAILVDALAKRHGLPCIVVGGPADADALVMLHDQTTEHRPALVDRPLLVVAAILRRAAAFVGNDSGLSHLAGLLGIPTLALFGPSDPTLWAPLGPRVRVVQSASLPSLPADVVLAELHALLASPS